MRTAFYDIKIDPYQIISLHDDLSEQRINERAILMDWVSKLKSCGNRTCQTFEDQE